MPKHPTFRVPMEFRGELVERMPAELYHSLDAVNSHGLMTLLRSPSHYLEQRERPDEPTAAMEFGTLVHSALLEPETFRSKMVVVPKFDRRTKAGKEDYADFMASLEDDAISLTEDQAEKITRMMDRLQAHPIASRLLSEGRAEVSYFWTDPLTGLECKARADYLRDLMIIDVKTCSDASYEAFSRDVYRLKYDVQAAHYSEGYKEIFKKVPSHLWLAIETTPPFEIALYVANEATMDKGLQRRNRAIKRLAECIEKDEFPGYDPKIQNLALPHWAFYDGEDD